MLNRIGDEDTICALSTAPGTGGIAVLRVSGSRALEIGRRLCSFLPAAAESHRVYYGILKSLDGLNALDEVLVTYFANARSFTSEETIEVSCHGGQVLTGAILNELILAGARMATRGEFTYRAFMNGRLDLVQAESVLALIESQTKQSAKVALRQLQGVLSVELRRIEDDLLWILAQLEASIDFSAEGVDVIPSQVVLGRTSGLIEFVSRMVASYQSGRVMRDGLQVALVGAPNAGKSSLLNALLREDRAIVTPHPGTTRDLVEGQLSYGGVPVTLVDTAGLRETEDEIERMGIARSRQVMSAADLVFYVIDLSHDSWRLDLERFVAGLQSRIMTPSESTFPQDHYFLFNKIDLDSKDDLQKRSRSLLQELGFGDRGYWISASRRTGLAEIEALFVEKVKLAAVDDGQVVMQARHLEGLQKILTALRIAAGLVREDASPEFIAFELQEAVRTIHELLGQEFDEQVIDRIFKEFCLGK